MKNKNILTRALGALETGEYTSSAHENARTLEAVLKKTEEVRPAEFLKRRKRLTALVAAAVLVCALSVTAGAAALISSMNIEVGDGGFFNAVLNSFQTVLHSETTLLPKTLPDNMEKNITAIKEAGEKRFRTIGGMEKELGFSFLQSDLLEYNTHLDNGQQPPVILCFFEGEEKKVFGMADAALLLKADPSVDITYRATFAVDEPSTIDGFYLSNDKEKENVSVIEYTSPKNGLTAQISLRDMHETASSGADEVGLHFVYDDISYDIIIDFTDTVEGERIAEDILDSFVME